MRDECAESVRVARGIILGITLSLAAWAGFALVVFSLVRLAE